MNKHLYIFAVGLFGFIQSASTITLETVWLKDVTTTSKTDKRTLSEIDLPNELAFHLKHGSKVVTLNLRRNHAINPNADFYFARKLKNGQTALVKSRNLEKKDQAYYQDEENFAFLTVRCIKQANTRCDRIVNGNIRIEDSMYDLRLAENEVTPGNLLEVKGTDGTLYVLKDQSINQRDILAEIKDAASLIKKRITDDLKDPLDGQETQSDIPPSDDTLSSGHIAATYNITATDKSRRQEKKQYSVKVAVLIDHTIWEFYSSMTPMMDSNKTSLVMTDIRESFSHIFNGVNMFYKGINDPSISIDVILTDFISFALHSFPKKFSKETVVNGKKYIDAALYHKDAKKWDEAKGLHNVRAFDVGIVFTRYDLFEDTIDNSLSGLSFIKGVCDTGWRMALVEARGLFWTIFTAVHELGHTLGAEHDGEGNSCKAEDNFVMRDENSEMKNIRSSRNPWLFSNCSVKAFKDTLKKKKCVTKPGSFYDNGEYMKYVQKEPGQRYSLDDQCRLLIGPNSTCCVSNLQLVCHSMRCTNPKTGMCMPELHGAARGTECGPAKWCIEAMCVPIPRNNRAVLSSEKG